MGEDSDNHRRIFDCGDDLQGATALWAVFDADIEDAFEQARRRVARVGLIGQGLGFVL